MKTTYFNTFSWNMDNMPKLIDKAELVLSALGIKNNPWAVGGSLAMLLSGVPLTRGVHDADIIITQESVKKVLAALNDGNPFMKRIPCNYYGAGSDKSRPCIKVKLANMPPMDLIVLSEEDFSKETRPIFSTILGRYIYIVTMESLVEVKAAWKRPKDIEDLKAICPLYFPEVTNIECIINMANDK